MSEKKQDDSKGSAATDESQVDVRTIKRLRVRTHLRGGDPKPAPSGPTPKT